MPRDPFSLLNDHLHVSRETFERLKIYHDLLLKWQAKINLVSNDSVSDIWHRHFLDSLQLKKHLPKNEKAIIDIGSGAGFPGMVLSIIGVPHIQLVESDGKKTSFLHEVSRLTGAIVTIYQGRAEDIFIENAGVIIARAVAELKSLLLLTAPHVSHETICLFPKGKNYAKEIEDAKKEWLFDYEVLPSITDKQGVILRLSNLKRQKL